MAQDKMAQENMAREIMVLNLTKSNVRACTGVFSCRQKCMERFSCVHQSYATFFRSHFFPRVPFSTWLVHFIIILPHPPPPPPPSSSPDSPSHPSAALFGNSLLIDEFVLKNGGNASQHFFFCFPRAGQA